MPDGCLDSSGRCDGEHESSGKVDQAGGLAVRLSDPSNYYITRANALEDNHAFSSEFET